MTDQQATPPTGLEPPADAAAQATLPRRPEAADRITTGHSTTGHSTTGQLPPGHSAAGYNTAGYNTPGRNTAGHNTASNNTASNNTAGHSAAEASSTHETRSWFSQRRIIVPLGGLLLAVMAIVGTGGGASIVNLKSAVLGAEVKSPEPISPATAIIGKSVRDGVFSFVVTSVQPPKPNLQSRTGAKQTAAGTFVIVRLDITNIGPAPRTLAATDQFLVSDKGKRFATSPMIASLPGTEKPFLEKINPGYTMSAAPLLFDVPAGTRIASIELHESLSSTGVKVRLP